MGVRNLPRGLESGIQKRGFSEILVMITRLEMRMLERQLKAVVSATSALFLVIGTVACGGGPGSSALKGDYEVVSVTLNTTGCDSEGEATDTSDLLDNGPDGIKGFIMVDSCTFSIPGLGSDTWLQFISCSDLEECYERKCSSNDIQIAQFQFQSGGDEEGWTTDGDSTSTFGNDEDLCEGTYYTVTMSLEEDGSLVIEKRSYEVEPFAETPMGGSGDFLWCDTEEAAKAAKPDCVELEVVRAKPVGADAPE